MLRALSDAKDLPEVQYVQDKTKNIVLPIAKSAAIGGAIGIAHPVISLGLTAVFTASALAYSLSDWCISPTCAPAMALIGGAYFSWLNLELDQIIAHCVNALGVPIIGDANSVDIAVKCGLVGAAVGGAIKAYGLFSGKDDQPAPETVMTNHRF